MVTVVIERNKAEDRIRDVLKNEVKPLNTFEIFNRVEKMDPSLDRMSIQHAIWSLIDSGDIVLGDDRSLKLNPS
jgi:hypothetical protein